MLLDDLILLLSLPGRVKEITYAEWRRRFRPMPVPGKERDRGFDRYWHHDKDTLPIGVTNGQLWTVKDGEGSSVYMTNGIGIIDVLGYVACRDSWGSGESIIVPDI